MNKFKVEGLFGRNIDEDTSIFQIGLCRVPMFFGRPYLPNEITIGGRRYVPADNRPYIEISEIV